MCVFMETYGSTETGYFSSVLNSQYNEMYYLTHFART